MAKLFGASLPLWSRLFPSKEEGPRGLNVLMPLSTQTSYILNLQLTGTGISMVNGVFIDNSNNLQAFTLTNTTTGQVISVPPQSQALMEMLTQKSGDNVQLVAASSGGVDVPIMLMNVEPSSSLIWSVVSPTINAGALTIQGNVNVFASASAPTNRNTTIAANNTAQQLAPANPARKRLIIQNPYLSTSQGIAAAEPIYFSFISAALCVPGTGFELPPGASFDTALGVSPNGIVYVNAPTAGHKIVATEF